MPSERNVQHPAVLIVDELGRQLGLGVQSLGHQLIGWLARAQEEVEDMWAEVQHVRKQETRSYPSD
jgi:hypothetical protein